MSQLEKISIRVSPGLLEAVDDLIDRGGSNLQLFPHGIPTRSEMMRLCVARGVEVWDAVVSQAKEESAEWEEAAEWAKES